MYCALAPGAVGTVYWVLSPATNLLTSSRPYLPRPYLPPPAPSCPLLPPPAACRSATPLSLHPLSSVLVLYSTQYLQRGSVRGRPRPCQGKSVGQQGWPRWRAGGGEGWVGESLPSGGFVSQGLPPHLHTHTLSPSYHSLSLYACTVRTCTCTGGESLPEGVVGVPRGVSVYFCRGLD